MSELRIVDETEEYLVVDKPGELVCHPTKGDWTSSLIGRVRHYLQDTEAEPRFVNRLDRETSGLVVISKLRDDHKRLCREMEAARKLYRCVVEGAPSASHGSIEQPIGRDEASPVAVKQTVRPDGRRCLTHWKLLSQAADASLLEVELVTGRMHQIRVHLAWLGHPVVGDKLYGPDETLYLELAEKSWTPRLRQALPTERHLLSAVEITTASHHWKLPTPPDIVTYRDWGGKAECSASPEPADR